MICKRMTKGDYCHMASKISLLSVNGNEKAHALIKKGFKYNAKFKKQALAILAEAKGV